MGGWIGLLVGFVDVSIAVTSRARLDNEISAVICLVPFGAVLAFTVASLRVMEIPPA